jgi:hypothetical protein
MLGVDIERSRFLERPLLQERLGVIRIDLERTAQAAFRRRPVPLAEKKDRAKATCASAEVLSIASVRKADAFASVNASWCGTTRNAACTQRARAKPACAAA